MKNKFIPYQFLLFVLISTLLFPVTLLAKDKLQSARFIDIPWLQKHINDENIVVLDTRQNSTCVSSHIKKALCLDMAATYDSYLTAPIPMIRSLLQSKGLKKENHIITYDNGNLYRAARVAWVLESAGFAKISILNGSYADWLASGFAVNNESRKPKKSTLTPSVNPDTVASLTRTVLAINNPNNYVIDVRSKAEYSGNYVDTQQAKRYSVKYPKTSRRGHIKSAINIPWSVNLAGHTKGLKPLDELKKYYSFLEKSHPIVLYCTAGDGSALSYAVLKSLGYDAAIYDGGWYEWSAHLTLPIE